MTTVADLILVGGGLANSLIAWRLRQVRPEVEVVVLERGSRLGGNHTWSFHSGDLTADQRAWIAPAVVRTWDSYEVRFPGHTRRLDSGYHSITSDRLHDVVSDALGARLRVGAEVEHVDPAAVRLADGETLRARAVVDGRGDPGGDALRIAYQKFLGLIVELETEHDLERPIVMDATVEQRDGFRFVYTLPFTSRSVLVEDTRYSDTPELDVDELRGEVQRYCVEHGLHVRRVEREEQGVLPIVLSGEIDAFWRRGEVGVPRSGLRAALFHPTTGYSLPDAVRLADLLGAWEGVPSSAELHDAIRERSLESWRQGRYFRFLNRMMFRAAEPAERFRILERFYRLPEPLIARFYAGRLTWRDRARILTGRPPVPVGRALRCLFEREAAAETAALQKGAKP
jgi:lycopene beta-cyclase